MTQPEGKSAKKNEAESSRHKQAGPEAVPASQVAAAGFLQKELTEKENN